MSEPDGMDGQTAPPSKVKTTEQTHGMLRGPMIGYDKDQSRGFSGMVPDRRYGGHRRVLAAALGCLILTGSPLAAQAPNLERVHRPAPSVERQADGRTRGGERPAETPPPAPAVNRIDQADDDKTREAEADRPEAEDLKAQIRAADATEKQVTASWWTVALSFFATCLIGWTLYETRKTARAAADGVTVAARSAQAAEDAVKVASDSAERQLRAYVFVKDAPIQFDEIGNVTCQVMFENTGATPAYDLIIYGRMCFQKYPLEKDLPKIDFHSSRYSQDTVGAGGI